jgi:hypothetical protein
MHILNHRLSQLRQSPENETLRKLVSVEVSGIVLCGTIEEVRHARVWTANILGCLEDDKCPGAIGAVGLLTGLLDILAVAEDFKHHEAWLTKNMKLTAPQKLMQKLVFMVSGERCQTAEEIEARYEELLGPQHIDQLQQAQEEVRPGTEETELPCEYDRHYESKSVAAQMLDGSWVGWVYWFGGGKHGEPEQVEWISDAYDVDVVEVLKPVKQFSRREEVQ